MKMTAYGNIDDNSSIILELPKKSLRLIGQLIHMHIEQPHINHEVCESTLAALVDQTDCVYYTAEDHGVYENNLNISMQVAEAVRTSKPISYVSYEKELKCES